MVAQRATVLFAVAILAWSCSEADDGSSRQVPPPRYVTAVFAPQLSSSAPTAFVGALVARDPLDLAADAEGEVAAIMGGPGDRVAAGAPLVRLSAPREDSALEAAAWEVETANAEVRRAALELARAADRPARGDRHPELYPAEELAASHSAAAQAQESLTATNALLGGAKARLSAAQGRVDRLVVRAPRAGRIARVFVATGAVVGPGTRLIRLVAPADLLVRFAVPPEESGSLRVGQAVIFVADVSGQPLAARILRIAPAIDLPAQLVFVEAGFVGSPARGAELLEGTLGAVSTRAARSVR
jgi:membrane fusion protein (multidrug efflux system)